MQHVTHSNTSSYLMLLLSLFSFCLLLAQLALCIFSILFFFTITPCLLSHLNFALPFLSLPLPPFPSLSETIEQKGVCRDIFHFWFSSWPDNGVLHSSLPLVKLLQEVRGISSDVSGPVVVHCRWEPDPPLNPFLSLTQ